jgi:hypothetical protein
MYARSDRAAAGDNWTIEPATGAKPLSSYEPYEIAIDAASEASPCEWFMTTAARFFHRKRTVYEHSNNCSH